MGLIGSIIIGILAGSIAGKLSKRESNSWLVDLFVGILGAIVGGKVFDLLGIYTDGIVGELITATVGAVLILWIVKKIF